MGRLLRTAALVAALAAAFAAPAAAVFEDVEVSPRARALGGSWAGLGDDEYAAFHHPAALAWWDAVGGGASTVRPFGYDFSSQQVVSVGLPLPGRWGGVALGLRRFGVDYQGQNLTRETTVTAAHGFRLMGDALSELAIGWSLSLYGLSYGRSVTGLDPGDAASMGVSIGATAVLRDRTRIGFKALNINGPNIGGRDKLDLTRKISVGVSYAPYSGVETALDITSEPGEAAQYRGGAEFQVASFAWLRAGIHTAPNVFTTGAGFAVGALRFDYGLSTGGGVLGESHQFGIAYRERPPR
jgi:hypothetical protein